ncbi:MAG TPA: hypothetical protein ENI27_07550 [bacterium]|nr:hypothetical protein [bacterium]
MSEITGKWDRGTPSEPGLYAVAFTPGRGGLDSRGRKGESPALIYKMEPGEVWPHATPWMFLRLTDLPQCEMVPEVSWQSNCYCDSCKPFTEQWNAEKGD